jgi:hypothetical protein
MRVIVESPFAGGFANVKYPRVHQGLSQPWRVTVRFASFVHPEGCPQRLHPRRAPQGHRRRQRLARGRRLRRSLHGPGRHPWDADRRNEGGEGWQAHPHALAPRAPAGGNSRMKVIATHELTAESMNAMSQTELSAYLQRARLLRHPRGPRCHKATTGRYN